MTPRMHLVAVGIILLISLAGLFLSGKIGFGEKEAASTSDATEFLIIASATWGENCNDYIQNNNDNPQRDEKNAIISERLPLVRKDNVLRRVSGMCDTRASCDFPIKKEALGPDPAPGCTKALVVDYRCGELGITQRVTAYSGSAFSLDCKTPRDAK